MVLVVQHIRVHIFSWWFGSGKHWPILSTLAALAALAVCVHCGNNADRQALSFRILARYHAKQAFTHLVAETKRPEHCLVTTGIYRYAVNT